MREQINSRAHAKCDSPDCGQEWEVLLLGTGQWTRMKVVSEFEDSVELKVEGAEQRPDKAKTLSTTRQAMRDGSIYRRAS